MAVKMSYTHYQLPAKDGYFDVQTSEDPDYPGVDIEYTPKGGDGGFTLPRVVVEFPKDEDCPRVLIWDDPDSEDYTIAVPLANVKGKTRKDA